MSLVSLLILLLIAAVCGAVGQAIAGSVRGGLLVTIIVGFIGALFGSWLAGKLGLGEPLMLNIGGQPFPVLWSIIGGVAGVIAFPIIPDALTTGNWLPLAIPLVALPFVISSFWWMSAPTKEGRAVLDRIAGFKQYLSITERERLDRADAQAHGAPGDRARPLHALPGVRLLGRRGSPAPLQLSAIARSARILLS